MSAGASTRVPPNARPPTVGSGDEPGQGEKDGWARNSRDHFPSFSGSGVRERNPKRFRRKGGQGSAGDCLQKDLLISVFVQEKIPHLVRHLGAARGALRLDRAVQAFRNVDCEALHGALIRGRCRPSLPTRPRLVAQPRPSVSFR